MSPRYQTSDDDRKRVVQAYIQQQTTTSISDVLGIKPQTIRAIIKLYKDTGRICTLKRGGRHETKLNNHQKDIIVSWINADCSMTLQAIAAKVSTAFGISISKSTVDRILGDFHFSWKRTSNQPVARNDIAGIHARKIYADMYMEFLGSYCERDFLFVDEFGINVSMRSRHGRSMVGTRAVQRVSTLRSRNITVGAAMSTQGIIHFKWQDSAFKSSSFTDYLTEVCDKLSQRNQSNRIFVVDNASIHNNQMTRQMLNLRGHVLMFLPPYSPFLNPIENLFSKWKEKIRSNRPNNEDELIVALQTASQTITEQDCNGYYRHMFRMLTLCQRGEQIIDD